MSAKRLLPMVLLLLIMLGLVVWNKRQPAPPPPDAALGLVRMVPGGVTAETISGLDLYQGESPQEAIQLRQRQGAWVLHSHFDAPVRSGALRPLLEQLGALQGEARSDAVEALKDYQLEEAQALHVRIYTDKPDTPTAHLLAGKGSGRHGFMRQPNEARVYAVNINLRAQAGLLADSDTSSGLSPHPWADLRLIDVPQEHLQALELHTPAMHLHLVRQPTPPTASGSPPEPQGTWRVEQPAGNYAVKPEVLQHLLESWRTLKAATVARPGAATYGLDPAPYRGTLHVQSSQQVAVLVGNAVDKQGSQRYYIQKGANTPVYIVPGWTRDDLFPPLGSLLDLRLVAVAAADLTTLTLQYEGQSWEFAQQSASSNSETTPVPGVWRFVTMPGLAMDQEALTSLLTLLTTLNADDLLLATPAETGPERPVWRLAWTQRDGLARQLSLGQSSSGEAERFYARLDGGKGVFVLSATTYQQLTAALEAVRQLALQ